MDARQFDRISTSVGTRTRRTVLRGVAGATLATLGVARQSGADPKGKPYVCVPAGTNCTIVKCITVLRTPQEVKQLEEAGLVCTKVKEKKLTQ